MAAMVFDKLNFCFEKTHIEAQTVSNFAFQVLDFQRILRALPKRLERKRILENVLYFFTHFRLRVARNGDIIHIAERNTRLIQAKLDGFSR